MDLSRSSNGPGMIDSHIHVVPPRLPGVGNLNPVLDTPAEAVAAILRQEMDAAGVRQALAMGCWSAPDDDPLGVAGTLQIARLVPRLHALGIADPMRTSPDHLPPAAALAGLR